VGYLRDAIGRGEGVRQRGVVLRNPSELPRATCTQYYGTWGGYKGNMEGQLTDVKILAAGRDETD
jgi:hypothetical protein